MLIYCQVSVYQLSKHLQLSAKNGACFFHHNIKCFYPVFDNVVPNFNTQICKKCVAQGVRVYTWWEAELGCCSTLFKLSLRGRYGDFIIVAQSNIRVYVSVRMIHSSTL